MPSWAKFDDMAVSRIRVIRSGRVELHHPFCVSCGTRHNLNLPQMVEAQMVMQPKPHSGIGFNREYAPARADE
jgi:hypothetical protein